MANKKTIGSLKEEAVRVYDGMISVFPQFSQEEVLNVSELVPKFNGCFATNNSTVCFVSDNEVFVIPNTRETMSILESARFRKEYFWVPFSNWDYPKQEQAKWEALQKKARETRKKEFVADCMEYCDKYNIGSIKEETLQNCFEMPEWGVEVKHHYFEDCYYPIINNYCLDARATNNIGHFCKNNGKVVFVYRNGKTYVAKGYKILEELRMARYTESGLFVPFSNGEQIQDEDLRARWESIKKN